MATWTKEGKDLNALLREAAQIDPMIGEGLGDIESIHEGGDLLHRIVEIGWTQVYDADGLVVDQRVEVDLDKWAWIRKGKPIYSQGRRAYGAWEPGFTLSTRQEIERFPQGPREWTPKSPAILYYFMLTVSKEKGNKAMKKLAADVGWELISG